MGPVLIGFRLRPAASRVHAVLVRCRINRMRYIDRIAGEPIRGDEHPHTGSMTASVSQGSAISPRAMDAWQGARTAP